MSGLRLDPACRDMGSACRQLSMCLLQVKRSRSDSRESSSRHNVKKPRSGNESPKGLSVRDMCVRKATRLPKSLLLFLLITPVLVSFRLCADLLGCLACITQQWFICQFSNFLQFLVSARAYVCFQLLCRILLGESFLLSLWGTGAPQR